MSRIFSTFLQITGRVPPKAVWETLSWKIEVKASKDVWVLGRGLGSIIWGVVPGPKKKEDIGKPRG